MNAKLLSAYHWHWRDLYSPRGVLAGLGIALGLGRLFSVGTMPALVFGPALLFALALISAGLVLLVSLPIRLKILGRAGAAYAVFAFALLMAGTWGSAAATLYLYCVVLCVWEAITRRAYEC